MNKDYDDYIIINDDGVLKEGELITKFDVKDLGSYVLYRIENDIYGAKYEFNGENTKLITELSDIELEILNSVYENLEV